MKELDDHQTKDSPFVYLIDDDPAVRRSLTALMGASELECQYFDRPSAFLAGYQDRGPACVVTDIRMPGMTGLELFDRMRSAGIDHPVIIMTGYSEVETVIRSFRNGVLDFFEKPVAGSLLLERIHQAIKQDRIAREKRARSAYLRESIAKLTDRERQVMGMLVEGKANKEIAWQLKLSDKAIAAHRANLLSKMQTDSLAQLIRQVTGSDLHTPMPSIGPATSDAVA
jgi:FixJ family two-component response regulator